MSIAFKADIEELRSMIGRRHDIEGTLDDEDEDGVELPKPWVLYLDANRKSCQKCCMWQSPIL